MRKKIPVEELRIGMFIDGFGQSWFKTPFFKHKFLLKESSQIEKIKSAGLTSVFIDTDKGEFTSGTAGGMASGMEGDAQEETPGSGPFHLPAAGQEEIRPGTRQHANPDANKEEHAALEYNDYVQKKDNLFQIDKLSLIEGTFLTFNLYHKDGLAIRPYVTYKNRDVEVTADMVAIEGEILIEREAVPKYKQYLKEAVKHAPSDLSRQKVQSTIIKENAKVLIKELLENPTNSEKMKECKDSVEGIIDNIITNKGIITNLLTMNKHDYYTYAHSVNTSVYALGTALTMGIKSERQLFAIGMGSLLHDIGKSTIPSEIINKPLERLTDFELNIIQQHVKEGGKLVKLFKGIPEEALFCVLEHHEKLSGKGYPSGLKNETMHLSGKVTAVVNLYDTLTTSRPNHKAMAPFEALSLIRNLNQDYDMEIFKHFITMLGKSA